MINLHDKSSNVRNLFRPVAHVFFTVVLQQVAKRCLQRQAYESGPENLHIEDVHRKAQLNPSWHKLVQVLEIWIFAGKNQDI